MNIAAPRWGPDVRRPPPGVTAPVVVRFRAGRPTAQPDEEDLSRRLCQAMQNSLPSGSARVTQVCGPSWPS